jgi:hypothetical protein
VTRNYTIVVLTRLARALKTNPNRLLMPRRSLVGLSVIESGIRTITLNTWTRFTSIRTPILNRYRCLPNSDFLVRHPLGEVGAFVSNFKNNKNRMYVGVATSVVSLCLTGIGASQSRAQSAAPQVLPPVSIDAPQQRARVMTTARPRGVSQRSARVAPRPPTERPAAVVPVTTMGTTRTIGAPAPAYAGGQVAQGGTLGLLGSTNGMNVPFSTVNYTSQLIENQQARTAADTLINDSSVRLTTAGNGFSDEFQIRGFPVASGDVGFNGLYGLVSSSRVPAQIIERIELLKGPGALINGIAPGGSVGGGINIVSKRAGEVPFARLTPFFMSAGNYGLHLETSNRYGENKEWGVRFNGVGRNGEASIDNGNWRTGLGALSLDYRGERLRWTVDAISQNDDTKNFRPQIGIQATVPFIPVPPDARSNWYPGTLLRQRDNTIATGLEYDLSESLTAYAGIGYREGESYQTFPDSRVTGFPPGGVDALGNFQTHQRLLRLLQQDDERQRRHTVAFPGRARHSCGQSRLDRLLPGERQRICCQYAGAIGSIEYLQPVPASGGHWRAPAASASQRDNAQERGDRRHHVIPE